MKAVDLVILGALFGTFCLSTVAALEPVTARCAIHRPPLFRYSGNHRTLSIACHINNPLTRFIYLQAILATDPYHDWQRT